jgi:hypothetical protein
MQCDAKQPSGSGGKDNHEDEEYDVASASAQELELQLMTEVFEAAGVPLAGAPRFFSMNIVAKFREQGHLPIMLKTQQEVAAELARGEPVPASHKCRRRDTKKNSMLHVNTPFKIDRVRVTYRYRKTSFVRRNGRVHTNFPLQHVFAYTRGGKARTVKLCQSSADPVLSMVLSGFSTRAEALRDAETLAGHLGLADPRVSSSKVTMMNVSARMAACVDLARWRQAAVEMGACEVQEPPSERFKLVCRVPMEGRAKPLTCNVFQSGALSLMGVVGRDEVRRLVVWLASVARCPGAVVGIAAVADAVERPPPPDRQQAPAPDPGRGDPVVEETPCAVPSPDREDDGMQELLRWASVLED